MPDFKQVNSPLDFSGTMHVPEANHAHKHLELGLRKIVDSPHLCRVLVPCRTRSDSLVPGIQMSTLQNIINGYTTF